MHRLEEVEEAAEDAVDAVDAVGAAGAVGVSRKGHTPTNSCTGRGGGANRIRLIIFL